MAWSFGDSFDLYTAVGDMVNGYWDVSAMTTASFVAGRFANSRALQFASTTNQTLTKASGVNDAVHHIAVAFQQTAAISGSATGLCLQLVDGATTQVTICFRSDGAIQFFAGTTVGTSLGVYTGAFPVANTWYAFEFEVVVNNTTGSVAVRKNGNNVNDFTVTGVNTRVSANNYANKLTVNEASTVNTQVIDDLFWQSGAATGAWLGDIRCYTRMPVSDQSVVFSKSPTTYVQAPQGTNSTITPQVANSYYDAVTAAYDGTVSTLTLSIAAGYTGNIKCTVFNDGGNTPGTIRSTATTLVNPTTGNNTITFPTPFSVSKGVQYWVGFASDTAAASAWNVRGASGGYFSSTTGYSAFPVASPTIAGTNSNYIIFSWPISITTNNCLVNEAQQDGLTSYVYDSNPGDQDFYGVGSIATTPAVVIATTVRAYAQKSDAGTRTLAAQLKSGATVVASPTLVLTTSGFLWTWRTDTIDPNTGAAWTAAAVNNAQIGPKVIA